MERRVGAARLAEGLEDVRRRSVRPRQGLDYGRLVADWVSGGYRRVASEAINR